MTIRFLRCCVLALSVGAMSQPVLADDIFKSERFATDIEDSVWQEAEAVLPSFPKEESLVEFYVGPTVTNHYFLDPTTLSVGDDGVVRYALVIKTAGGARNVSFEGIHCAERQVKVYAMGTAAGQWSRARNPEWRLIEKKTVNGHHAVLNREILCLDGVPPVNADAARVALRRAQR